MTLARACRGLYLQPNPLPDPDRWREVHDPPERVRSALAEIYAYHRANEAMFSHVLADARHVVMRPYHSERGELSPESVGGGTVRMLLRLCYGHRW
ncbi:MAG: hypothetical protein ACM3QU_07720 [Verrucomicrobiota bacterium]